MKTNSENLIPFRSGIYNKDKINLNKILSSLKNHPRIKETGSILTFSGIVRSTSKNGKFVRKLTIDAYEELANKSIKKICDDIKELPGIVDVIIVHFKGEFDVSDDLVHVIVGSSHRDEGFKALRLAVERYKNEVAVWKKEDYINGTSGWVH